MSWAQAACRNYPPELWWPPSYSLTMADGAHVTQDIVDVWLRIVRAICATCQVRERCLALGMNEPDGIWGGKTAQERAALRKGQPSLDVA